jgi:hypothetical protein
MIECTYYYLIYTYLNPETMKSEYNLFLVWTAIVLLINFGLLHSQSTTAEQNWPQFRGPTAVGMHLKVL